MLDSFLKLFVQNVEPYTPITSSDSYWNRLYPIMADIENWETRVECDRDAWEKELFHNNALAHTYIDMYTDKADFIILPFEIDKDDWFEFFLMLINQELVLCFFKKSEWF